MNIWLKHLERFGPNVDRALETPIELGAEGASVNNAKLSGKRTKIFVFLRRIVLCLYDPFVFCNQGGKCFGNRYTSQQFYQ